MNNEMYKELEKLLEKYTKEVENSDLKENTKKTYLLHSRNFVRWIKGDFTPGGTLK